MSFISILQSIHLKQVFLQSSLPYSQLHSHCLHFFNIILTLIFTELSKFWVKLLSHFVSLLSMSSFTSKFNDSSLMFGLISGSEMLSFIVVQVFHFVRRHRWDITDDIFYGYVWPHSWVSTPLPLRSNFWSTFLHKRHNSLWFVFLCNHCRLRSLSSTSDTCSFVLEQTSRVLFIGHFLLHHRFNG